MTLTNEQIEALAVLLTAHTGASPTYGSIWIAPDMETCCRASAALRQWIEERRVIVLLEDSVDRLIKQRNQLEGERDTLKEIRAQQKEDFDRAAKLQEERDREDRLVHAGWEWGHGDEQYIWIDPNDSTRNVLHADRAAAARLAEAKLEKP